MERTVRSDIQVLRGLAVCAVILFHASERTFPNGYLGVDAFFVISGFVITPKLCEIFENYQKGNDRLLTGIKSFFVHRLLRLIPALLVTLVLSGLLLFFLAPYEDQKRIGMQGLATIFALGNFGAYKYSGDYFTPNPNPLVHTWSLSVEEQIYIFIPFAMVLWITVLRRNTKTLFGTMAVLSLILFTFPDLESKIYSPIGLSLEGFGFYSPFARLWQFCIGGLIYLCFDLNTNRLIGVRTKFITFSAIIGLFISTLFFSFDWDSKIMSILTTIVTSLAIQYKCFLFSSKILIIFERLGNQSYSTYLIHMPLLYLARFSPFLGSKIDTNRDVPVFISIALALALGYLSYVKVEQRFRFNGAVKHINSRFILYSLVSYFLVFALIVYSVQMNWLAQPKYGRSTGQSSMQWNNRCDFIEPNQPVCELGNVSHPLVLLIGDSHAASISKVIADIGKENQLSIAIGTKGSCPFILENMTLDDLTEDCIEHNQSIREFVESREVKTIVYFQRRISSKYEHLTLNNSEKESLQNSYAQRILYALSNLGLEKQRIIVMGFIPEATGEPTRLGYLLGERSKFITQTNDDNILWKMIVDKYGFTYLDTFKEICRGSTCPFKTVDNQWILEDWQHLSIAGANLLKHVIANNFRSIEYLANE